jgi:hypothetical protein
MPITISSDSPKRASRELFSTVSLCLFTILPSFIVIVLDYIVRDEYGVDHRGMLAPVVDGLFVQSAFISMRRYIAHLG